MKIVIVLGVIAVVLAALSSGLWGGHGWLIERYSGKGNNPQHTSAFTALCVVLADRFGRLERPIQDKEDLRVSNASWPASAKIQHCLGNEREEQQNPQPHE